MKNIALLCDSSADITKQEAEELDIHVIRMPITINGKEYIEEETIFDQDIIEALNKEEQVKTAQPVIGDIVKTWDHLLETYDEVFYLPLSKALSGTCHVAIGLAKQYNGRVTVVDSEYACYPIVKHCHCYRYHCCRYLSAHSTKKETGGRNQYVCDSDSRNLDCFKKWGKNIPSSSCISRLVEDSATFESRSWRN